MRNVNKAALAVTVLVLAGCGSFGFENKRVDYQSQAQRAPSLEVPPDLSTPSTEGRYVIPGSEGETVASYADYASGGGAPVAAHPVVVAPVVASAPETTTVSAKPQSASSLAHLERDGARRWLVVSESAESIWPKLKSFWNDRSVKLVVDDEAAGVIETEWYETRAKIEEDGIRGVLGKLSDGMYSAANRDMFRLRIERTHDGATSEIYIAHYGKEEVVDASGNSFKWQNRSSDPELEATTLQQLMAKLNVFVPRSTAAGASQISASASVQAVDQADGTRLIQLSEPFDKAWQHVGLALERTKQNVEDRNRAEGVYYVNTVAADQAHLLPLLGGGSRPVILHVRVRESAGVCSVTVTDDDGSSSRAARKLFDKLYQQLQ